MIDEILRHIDMDVKRYISKRTTHHRTQSSERGCQRLTSLRMVSAAGWSGGTPRLMADALPQLHERRRRTQKLLSGPYKRCSAFMSHEQWPPERLLKDTSPRADRRPKMDPQTLLRRLAITVTADQSTQSFLTLRVMKLQTPEVYAGRMQKRKHG